MDHPGLRRSNVIYSTTYYIHRTQESAGLGTFGQERRTLGRVSPVRTRGFIESRLLWPAELHDSFIVTVDHQVSRERRHRRTSWSPKSLVLMSQIKHFCLWICMYA
jgi:hypothetical protein